jgi:hypothetical protein
LVVLVFSDSINKNKSDFYSYYRLWIFERLAYVFSL